MASTLLSLPGANILAFPGSFPGFGPLVYLAGGSAPPSIPTGLAGSIISVSQNNISWVPSTGGPVGYILQRSTHDGNSFVTIANQVGTTFSDTGLPVTTATENYYYQVASYNAAGILSKWSLIAIVSHNVAGTVTVDATWLATVGNGGPDGPWTFKTANTKYQLTADATAKDSGFILGNPNIILDGNGHILNYSTRNPPPTVVNGGFETGALGVTVPGWDITGAPAASVVASPLGFSSVGGSTKSLQFTLFYTSQVIVTAAGSYINIPASGVGKPYIASAAPQSNDPSNYLMGFTLRVIDTVTLAVLATGNPISNGIGRTIFAIAHWVPANTNPVKLQITVDPYLLPAGSQSDGITNGTTTLQTVSSVWTIADVNNTVVQIAGVKYLVVGYTNGTTVTVDKVIPGIASGVALTFYALRGGNLTMDYVYCFTEGDVGVVIGPNFGSLVAPLNAAPYSTDIFNNKGGCIVMNLAINQGQAKAYGTSSIYFLSSQDNVVNNCTGTLASLDSEFISGDTNAGSVVINNNFTFNQDGATFYISDRLQAYAAIGLTNSGKQAGKSTYVLCDSNVVTGYPQHGILTDLNIIGPITLTNNNVRLKTQVTDGYGITLENVYNTTVLFNTLNNDNGRCILIDNFGSAVDVINNNIEIGWNTGSAVELPNIEYSATNPEALDATAFRMRTFGTPGCRNTNINIHDNNFTATADDTTCRAGVACRITAPADFAIITPVVVNGVTYVGGNTTAGSAVINAPDNVTGATGGPGQFTLGIVGRSIQIYGGSPAITLGTYTVIGFTDSKNVTVDRPLPSTSTGVTFYTVPIPYNITIKNNNFKAIINSVNTARYAMGLSLSGIDAGLNFNIINNIIESNDIAVAIGATDSFGSGNYDITLQGNDIVQSRSGPRRAFASICAGRYNSVNTTNIRYIDTRFSGGATPTIVWGGNSQFPTSPTSNAIIGHMLSLNITHNGITAVGATIIITDKNSVVVWTGTVGNGMIQGIQLNHDTNTYNGSTAVTIVNPYNIAVIYNGVTTNVSATINNSQVVNISV